MASVSMDSVKELREKTGVGLAKCKEALEANACDIQKSIDYLRKKGMASAAKKSERTTAEGAILVHDTADKLYYLELCAETDFVVSNEKFVHFHEQLMKELVGNQETDPVKFLTKSSIEIKPGETIDTLRKEMVATMGENLKISKLGIIEKKGGASYGIYAHGGKNKLITLIEISNCEQGASLAKELAMQVAADSPTYISREDVPVEVQEKEKEIYASQMESSGKKKPPEIMDKILRGKIEAFFGQVCLVDQNFIKDPSVKIAQYLEKEASKEAKVTLMLRLQVGV